MRFIDVDVLLDMMDKRYKEKKGIVPNNLAEGFMQMEKLIREQPIVNTWIPCSEKLPTAEDFKNSIDEMLLYTDINGEVSECCLDWFYDYIDEIIAWQPFPEGYKEIK